MRIGPFAAAVAAVVASPAVIPARVARADVTACIAASEEAIALRKQGKLHESLRSLAACADPACPAEIKAECTQRITDVNAELPTLTLIFKDRSGNDLTGVKVTMDGAPFPGTLDGRAVPLNPGEHVFRFEAEGLPPLEKRMVLRMKEKDRRETVVLTAPPPPSFWTPQRAAGIAVMGVGVVGLALGGVFTGFAASAKSKENSNCTAASCINYPQAVADYDAATKNATGATIGFVAGGVLAAGGLVLFLTAPRPKPAAVTGRSFHISPLIAGSSGGLRLGGSF
jgi:hypothetical protein